MDFRKNERFGSRKHGSIEAFLARKFYARFTFSTFDIDDKKKQTTSKHIDRWNG